MTDEDVDFFTCKRASKGGGKCEYEIPLVQEHLSIFKPATRQLSAICPECGMVNILSKEQSAPLIERYFAGEIEAALAEQEEEEDSGVLALFPSTSYADRVIESLELLGYTGKSWKPKLKTMREFLTDIPAYQTADGLHSFLAKFKVDVQIIPLVIQRVFGARAEESRPDYSALLGGQPSYPAGPGFPADPSIQAYQAQGYRVQQAPGGHLILIPPQPYPPSPSPRARDDDTIEIEEKLDKDGNVIGRIYRGSAAKAMQQTSREPSEMDMLGKLIVLLKETGVIKPDAPQQKSDPALAELKAGLEGVGNRIAQLAQGGKSDDATLKIISKYEQRLDEMSNQLKEVQSSQHQKEIAGLQEQIANLREQAKGAARSGMSAEEREFEARRKNLETVTDRIEGLGQKILDPIAKLNETQISMNHFLVLRQLEQQDNVTPGTYINAVNPTQQTITRQDLDGTVERWKQKKEAALAAQQGGDST
jgi:hypothetical protein